MRLIVIMLLTLAPLPFELKHPMKPGVAEAFRNNPASPDELNKESRGASWRNDPYQRTKYAKFSCNKGWCIHCDDPDCPSCKDCVYAK